MRSTTDIHTYFGLSYSAYLVIPRLILQSMPPEWQQEFIHLMDQVEEQYVIPEAEYMVKKRDIDTKRFVGDPMADYRHGKIEAKPADGEASR